MNKFARGYGCASEFRVVPLYVLAVELSSRGPVEDYIMPRYEKIWLDEFDAGTASCPDVEGAGSVEP